MSQEDDRLWRALAASRPEAFWLGQKRRILGRVRAGRPMRALWPLAPAMALTALILMLHLRRPAAPPPKAAPRAQEWELLERLDLLENWDAIRTLDVAGGPS